MKRLHEFLDNTPKIESNDDKYALESNYMLGVKLDGELAIKLGSMIAYKGEIKFKKESSFKGGIGSFIKKKMTGEGGSFATATGSGILYLADSGKQIQLIQLDGDAVTVNGNDILFIEPQLNQEIVTAKSVGAALSGGLFNVKIEGTGAIGITTHQPPFVMPVRPGEPVITDPQATVAWSSNLTPEFKKDVSFGSLIGRGSGEEFQMKFDGEGFVVVQPFEEVPTSFTKG